MVPTEYAEEIASAIYRVLRPQNKAEEPKVVQMRQSLCRLQMVQILRTIHGCGLAEAASITESVVKNFQHEQGEQHASDQRSG